MSAALDDLRNGVVLAELGGYGDGPYCAEHGAGAALVMLGTYIVDPGDAVPYPPAFVFKRGRAHYGDYLKRHVAAARAAGGAVGTSVVSIELEDTVDFLQAAAAAGADYVSLCAHSGMRMFLDAGVSSALLLRANRPRLRQWATAIAATDVPAIFKIGTLAGADTAGAVEEIAAAGVPVVHVDVGETDAGGAGLALIEELRGRCPLLIAGGGIRDLEGARRALEAGADAVAIGTAAMGDPGLCGRLQRQLRR